MSYIFIHIPKTAGSLIKILLKISPKTPNIKFNLPKNMEDSYLGHYRVSEIKETYTNKKLKYFSIVRNPYDRAFSMWKFLQLSRSNSDHVLLPKIEDNFLDFLSSLKSNKYDSRFFKSQSYFLDEDFENITTIKYEEMNKIKDFLEENNVRWMDKKINQSPGIYYKDAYVSELSKEIVKELYAEDFKRFNYDIDL